MSNSNLFSSISSIFTTSCRMSERYFFALTVTVAVCLEAGSYLLKNSVGALRVWFAGVPDKVVNIF